MSFDIVVAVDLDWGIGKDGALPWPRLKADLAHFRKVTSEAPQGKRNAIVMGRKTWQSKEVAGKPLPRRWNVVVTRAGLGAAPPEDVLVVPSLDAALAATAAAADVADAFVVGGAELIRIALGHAQLRWIYLTRIAGRFGCDTHLPDLDAAGFRADAAWPAVAHEDAGVTFRMERLLKPA